jgi:hypothetical protein
MAKNFKKLIVSFIFLVFSTLSILFIACPGGGGSGNGSGGGSSSSAPSYIDNGVTVTPNPVTLPKSGTQVFTAALTGSSSSINCTWLVMESNGGSFSSNTYTAPNIIGVFHVRGTYAADTTKYGFATVYVVASSSSSSSSSIGGGGGSSSSSSSSIIGYYYTGTFDYKVNGSASGFTFNDEAVFNSSSITLTSCTPSYGTLGWKSNSHNNTQYTVNDTAGGSTWTSNGWQLLNDSIWSVEIDFDTSGNQLYILINNLTMNATILPQNITGSYFIAGGQLITALPADRSSLIGNNVSGTTISGAPFTLTWNLTRYSN